MFKRRRGQKLKTGYDKKPKTSKKRNHYVGRLLVAPTKKVGISERLIKIVIYIALRLVTKPSKWKDPQKNYEIIDRSYKRFMSNDFIYIPSSFAYNLIMAFMPIIALISFIYSFDSVHTFLQFGNGKSNGDALTNVLGKFIPGLESILDSLGSLTHNSDAATAEGAKVIMILSLVVTTWIASGGFSKLVYTQSYIYNHKFTGGFWMNRFKGMFIVLGFTIFLFLALSANIAITHLIATSGMSDAAQQTLTYLFLIIGLFLLTFFGFLGMFKLTPRFVIRWRDVVPGAMITAIPTTLFLSLFGTISTLWNYELYGVLGAIMYIGMSCLLVSYFIFVGLTVNSSYYKTFVGTVLKNKWTFSKK